MKDTLIDASTFTARGGKELVNDPNILDFPRTVDLRVYHLGLRPGEVANRIVCTHANPFFTTPLIVPGIQATVGSPSRAEALAALLDKRPEPFKLASERGFLTITGRYGGVPVSIVSIGMGSPNMDFFVRETRESVNGDMVIIRFRQNYSLLSDFYSEMSYETKGWGRVARSQIFRFRLLWFPSTVSKSAGT